MGMSDKVLLKNAVPAAAKAIDEMANPSKVSVDDGIPLALLRNCKGIAFITIYKAGMFFLGGQVGGGCVITKIPDPSSPLGYKWSGPVGVQVGGLQGGLIFGGEKISSIIILNTEGAVRGFMGDGQIQFGGAMSLAAGPRGRNAAANVAVSNTKEIVPAYSYSTAKGAYLGATLDGVVLKVNRSDCQDFYGTPVSPEDILTGKANPPQSCDVLLKAITDLDTSFISNNTSGTFDSTLASAEKENKSDRSDLPSDWVELYTSEGKPYYYNESTNCTTWDKPTSEKAQIPARPAATELPPGWEELETETGKKYYCNRSLNVTQWSRP